MADAPEILKDEKLRDSYPKLNAAIRNSNEALSTANTAKTNADNAVTTANAANAKSDDTQQQLNNIVINNGQSDAEVLQARGSYAVLNDRLNDTDAQLAEREKETTRNANRFTSNRLLRIAHRGVEAIFPQNTLIAAEYAGIMGYDGSECDVQITLDGEWVLFHDDTLDYLTNGTGTVAEKTLAELKALSLENIPYVSRYPNVKIPTLREYLDVCSRYGLIPFIELKKYSSLTQLESFFNILKEYHMNDKAFIQSTLSVLVHIKNNYEPNVKAVTFIDGSTTSINDVKDTLPFSVVSLPHTTVTEAIVKEINLANLQCAVWRNGNGLLDIFDDLKKWGVHYTIGEVL